jgi:hypothetical protein
MDDRPEQDTISADFSKECSIRRAARVLQLKQRSIYDDLAHTLQNITLLVPSWDRLGQGDATTQAELLEEALGRLEDQNFANLVLQLAARTNPQ